MRGVGDGCSTTDYKKHARAAISANGFKIIAIGDNGAISIDPGSTIRVHLLNEFSRFQTVLSRS